MEREQIFNLISEWIYNNQYLISLDYEDIQESSNLSIDLGLDSLDRVGLAVYLEREFGISINDEVGEKLETVKEVVDYVFSLCEIS